MAYVRRDRDGWWWWRWWCCWCLRLPPVRFLAKCHGFGDEHVSEVADCARVCVAFLSLPCTWVRLQKGRRALDTEIKDRGREPDGGGEEEEKPVFTGTLRTRLTDFPAAPSTSPAVLPTPREAFPFLHRQDYQLNLRKEETKRDKDEEEEERQIHREKEKKEEENNI